MRVFRSNPKRKHFATQILILYNHLYTNRGSMPHRFKVIYYRKNNHSQEDVQSTSSWRSGPQVEGKAPVTIKHEMKPKSVGLFNRLKTGPIRVHATRRYALLLLTALVLSFLIGIAYFYPSNLNNTIISAGSELSSVFHSENNNIEFEDYVDEYTTDDLRYRLSQKYKYNRNSNSIPKLIWQTWKEPVEQITNKNLVNYIQTWSSQSGYKYNLITDDEINPLLKELYGDFPEIIQTFETLPKSILKFDFLRYLILFAKGGIYTDIDTSNLVRLDDWIDTKPKTLKKIFETSSIPNIGFVVGIEGDFDMPTWRYKMARRVQFCQWTFKSKIGHPILRELIHAIVDTTLNKFDQRLNHVKIDREYHTLHSIFTILNWTGPGIFTDSIFKHFNKIFSTTKFINNNPKPHIRHTEFEYYHKERNSIDVQDGKFVGWTNFTKISKPVLYDDVLIMPMNTFNAYNDVMEIEPNDDLTYVKHDFRGGWKNM